VSPPGNSQLGGITSTQNYAKRERQRAVPSTIMVPKKNSFDKSAAEGPPHGLQPLLLMCATCLRKPRSSRCNRDAWWKRKQLHGTTKATEEGGGRRGSLPGNACSSISPPPLLQDLTCSKKRIERQARASIWHPVSPTGHLS